MDIVAKFGRDDLAVLYIAREGKNYLEFVESLQPPHPREKKWVLIISTMYGCPVRCSMCDAGSYYKGKISKETMLNQIDFMVSKRFQEKILPVEKFKIQFARMGEPTLNPFVLAVLEDLPEIYHSKGLMPCISTIAPKAATNFLNELMEIKEELYSNGHFQLQFSIHSTDEKVRKKIIPYKIWSLEEIAEFGESYWSKNDRKITLNFAAERNNPIEPEKLINLYDPKKYFLKLTPINPTEKVKAHSIQSLITTELDEFASQKIQALKEIGFEVLLSIGEIEENLIGSNCGQHAIKFQKNVYSIGKFQGYPSNT